MELEVCQQASLAHFVKAWVVANEVLLHGCEAEHLINLAVDVDDCGNKGIASELCRDEEHGEYEVLFNAIGLQEEEESGFAQQRQSSIDHFKVLVYPATVSRR